ncbi:peptide-modifying radical SAM enzyme CbpB [Magnetospirillum aberrantis]|uniref:Peptide-modifying radical SAM enzyme CbpB n=1 Tax=Magnetospirillum aberrantis SpK TaxID=908842 RepID=A0A7C9QSM6_9PROT|nr:peptide-modifying radical SAM enzyme CbpB [Magnetospirillum aberrantis]NFV79442.1 peptide-modifying radical SAM enzyme CbpB [Magnetospirillum aberrantis SpK]
MSAVFHSEAPQGASALVPFDIGHDDYVAMIAPDDAFWSLVRRDSLEVAAADGALARAHATHSAEFRREMDMLRFHLKPSAVYFNATERCNLNCSYCYIPTGLRQGGKQMDAAQVRAALERLAEYFATTVPQGRKPQVIFHGAEPLLAKDALFVAMDDFADRFRFGIQTNATLLDQDAVTFLTTRGIGIGLSLDGAEATVADRTRKRWNGQGVHASTLDAIDRLRGYKGFNVICTMTQDNLPALTGMVEFLHEREVPACMLNVVRCTLPGARAVWAEDVPLAAAYVAALERSHQLYRDTGRKLVVANFANILISILAPTARRLMCDISPCGGGRSFFALAPDGKLFPCSEFIGLPEFAGGNLFHDRVEDVLESPAFRKVTGRKVEDIAACADCPIRHFCGSPCPAEAHEMRGGMDQVGAYCAFYREQARYAFRLIAEGRADDFLWDGWDDGTKLAFTC